MTEGLRERIMRQASRQARACGGAREGRRGTILVVVLVVVTISALAGTTAMYYGEAAASGAEVSLKRTRSRAMAWSGVQAVMAELDVQREKLLDGEAPLVTTQWQMFEEGGKRGIVRLVALEKDEAGLDRWVVSETAKLDVNSATAEMLGKLGALSEAQSAAVVGGKAFGSAEELVRVEGVGQLMGGKASDAGTEGLDEREEPLSGLVTVFSFDPNVQAGIDPGAADARGKLRVNLNTAWTEELGLAIRQRFGADAVNSAKKLFDDGEKFKTMADLAAVLKRTGMPVGAWPAIVDAFTVSPDPYIPGRVDINRASARVLAVIPGISTEAAADMVGRRQGLDSAVKRSIVWPLSEGILKEDEFVKAVDWMTTRSMQWRVRVEVGVIEVEAGESGRDIPELEERMVMEAVIDVSSERPRVAYLRDVTLLDAAAAMEQELEMSRERVADAVDSTDPVKDPSVPNATDGPAGEPAGGLDMDASLKLNTTLDFGMDDATPSASSSVVETSSPSAPAARPEVSVPEPVDRRIGRWTSRGRTEQPESKP